jgi:hypothetical protein
MINNTVHRPATIQRIRFGATRWQDCSPSPMKLVGRSAGGKAGVGTRPTR